MERLRVGVIGTGAWARAAHLPGFAALPDLDVVALAGIDRIEAESAARDFRVPAVYATGAELLARERPDLVAIVTPDDCHMGDAAAALAAGAHVLCEKPLAVTVAEARALAEQAAAAGVRTKVGFTLRAAPAVVRLREIVAGGGIGAVHHLQAFQQNGQFLDPGAPFHWKMDAERTGGGAIVEYGIHTLDLARWIVGEVARVAAVGRTQIPARPLPDGTGSRAVTVDDSTAWLMAFASGATAVCHAGWATTGRGPGLELRAYGSRGAVRCLLSDDLPGAQGLWLADAAAQRFAPVPLDPVSDEPWWRRFHAALIRDFVAEIRGTAPPSATFADGFKAQEILHAVQTAMREERWVEV